MKLTLHTDGGARGNPGPAGYGYVVVDVTNQAAEIILRKCGNYCGETTNNQAEYYGLISGLSWIQVNFPDLDELDIYMDSLLIVNQIKGTFRVKHPELAKRHAEATAILKKFKHWSISHTYREGNTSADELVNLAIDLKCEVTG
jgi:ribonuclease HI